MTEFDERAARVPVATARQWQRAHGQAAVDWMRSSGVAQRMFDDVRLAVEQTVAWCVGGDPERARRVLDQYPEVLANCDLLPFDEMEQALAYLILHLPDRYCRMFQVLERLLVAGRLPVGRSKRFAAVDIGAGPGPGIFAMRNFYAALAHYVSLHDPMWCVAPLGYSRVVERSQAMPRVMHYFAEHLVMAEQGRTAGGGGHDREPNPCAGELDRSVPPFGADDGDFSTWNVTEKHHAARQRLANQLAWEFDLDDVTAAREAAEELSGHPFRFALAGMMNFLTTADAIPRFSTALNNLMGGSLVQGGVVVVLGAVGGGYPEIYSQLDARAQDAHLELVEGFDEPLQAGHRAEELTATRDLMRTIWANLEALAGDTTAVQDKLRQIGAADIFDDTIAFTLPTFRVRAYRQGQYRWRSKRPPRPTPPSSSGG
ncbi:hypothetical protein ACIBCD_34050 [Nocardia brasiliensis]|uniref:hypothetical protein n=1 Tax=Nocardia brasiliensis TaxID=37326 RepID=UPI0037BDAC39